MFCCGEHSVFICQSVMSVQGMFASVTGVFYYVFHFVSFVYRSDSSNNFILCFTTWLSVRDCNFECSTTGKELWSASPGKIVSQAVSLPDLNGDSVPDFLIATLPADQVWSVFCELHANRVFIYTEKASAVSVHTLLTQLIFLPGFFLLFWSFSAPGLRSVGLSNRTSCNL